jgi:hypothetical protein
MGRDGGLLAPCLVDIPPALSVLETTYSNETPEGKLLCRDSFPCPGKRDFRPLGIGGKPVDDHPTYQDLALKQLAIDSAFEMELNSKQF